jgi:type II secretory pathway predicted ATPase ExeA/cell division septation protein DedD
VQPSGSFPKRSAAHIGEGASLAPLVAVRPDPADALTYEPYFGLTEKPFSLNADARFVFESPTFGAARDGLLGGIRRREGLLVLTGEIGTGKTTLCRAVLRDLRRKTYSSLVPDPFASREDLLKMLLIDFGVLSIQELTTGVLRNASRTALSYLLAGFLDSLPADAHAVVIIDEAQNLSMPLIEETRILADTFGAQGRLQIIFVGQPELHAKLKLPEMRQVDQRVSGYHRLAAMNLEAVAGYLSHRVKAAGGDVARELFPADVVDALYRRSGGVPRLINRVCDRALQLAYERQAESVSKEILENALSDVGAATLSPTWDAIVFAEPATRSAVVAGIPPAPVAAAKSKTAAAVAGSIVDEFFAEERDDSFQDDVENWLATELASPARTPRPTPTSSTAAPVPPRPEPRRTTMAPRLEVPARPVRTDWPADVRSERYIDKLIRVWVKRAAITAAVLLVVIAAIAGGYSVWSKSVITDQAQAAPDAPAPAARLLTEPAPQAKAEATTAPAPAAPAEEAPAAVAAAAPVEATPVAPTSDYFVAVGVFASREHVNQIVDTLERAGLPAMQRSLQRGTRELNQIVLGPFLNRGDAAKDLQRLRELGGFDDAHVIAADARP